MLDLFQIVWWAVILFIVAKPILWLLFRSRGYKRELLDDPPGPGWQRTAERSLDPQTEQMIDVWYNPSTGERAYVRAAGSRGG